MSKRSASNGFTPIIILIGILVLVLAGGGGYYFFKVQKPEARFCTKDAKICPDGSAVGRFGPHCEFADCPVAVDEICEDSNTKAKMSFNDAVAIAKKSECETSGQLAENHFCNENSGTWWVDLNVTEPKSGCSPACVIDANTKKAEINWRCTGLLPSK